MLRQLVPAVTAGAADSQPLKFQPNQPHRPADFKPQNYLSPLELKPEYSDQVMKHNLTPSGKLDTLMAARLKEVGDWMKVNGEGIYANRKWLQGQQGALRFTRSKDGKYATTTRT